MAIQVYTDCKAYYGGYDFSAHSNELTMEFSAEIKDCTTFGAGFRSFLAGFINVTASVRGFWEAGVEKPDDKLFASIGATSDVLTMSPTDGSDGEIAFFMKAVDMDYTPTMPLGEVMNFTANFKGQSTQVLQGTVLKNGAVTATGDGTAYNVGAVAAGQSFYAAVHVIGVSGTATPTVTVTIESDAADDFTGSETTRATFTAATAIGAEWETPVAGAITDDWWRATWEVSGTDPSLEIIVVMGIK